MSEKEKLLTAERLRGLLNYDPETGIFTHKHANGRHSAGQATGFPEAHGYFRVSVDGREYRRCRLAWLYMTGSWPKEEIDHINANRADDRFINLREASRSMNAQNLRNPHKDNTHGLAGVMRFKKNSSKKVRWTSQIMVKGKRYHLGVFDTPEAAHQAYLKAKRELHEGCTI